MINAELRERLHKMQSVADGALRAIERRVQENLPPPESSRPPAVARAWWEGYLQAAEEIMEASR